MIPFLAPSDGDQVHARCATESAVATLVTASKVLKRRTRNKEIVSEHINRINNMTQHH